MSDVVIECRDVELGYGDAAIVRDVDLDVRRGEILALMGGSGSGKSTVLKAMAGLLPPRHGVVCLFGDDLYGVATTRRSALLRRTGVAFQHGALFGSLSVVDNVMLPVRELTDLPEAVAREMARMKLALVGLADYEARAPAELSGGQRKRVALARACVLDPEVVFCDEPTAGLDPVMSATIDEILLAFRDVLGVSIVAVTHDLDSIRTIADRGIMLGDGRVIAEGSIDELAASTDGRVHDFFHRTAPREGATRAASA